MAQDLNVKTRDEPHLGNRHRPDHESLLPNDDDIRQIEDLIANNSLGRRLSGLVRSIADIVRQSLNYAILWSIGLMAKVIEKAREKVVRIGKKISVHRRN
jgi:hypothetical protein